MVGHYRVDFCKTDGLDTDTVEDLLIREGLKEFAGDFGGVSLPPVFVEDDYGAKSDGDAGCAYEGEESLAI